MLEPMELVEPIIQRAEAANPPEGEDYYDDEGYLVCGRCHTRREIDIDIKECSGTVRRRVRALCDCREIAEREKSERERKEREMAAIESLRRHSLMDSALSAATFDVFRANSNNAKILKLCKSYAERFDQMMANNQGLLMLGGVGTGKTFAAACIANFLLDKMVPVVMTSFVKLLESVKGFDREGNTVIEQLNRAKLLIVDDLGAERGTDYAVERVYDIVDSRYRAKLPIILTTNMSIEEMKAVTDIRYARIYDRIFEMCYPVKFVGNSWRRSKAAKRFEEMEKLLEGD